MSSILRDLSYYKRIHLAVLFGAAVATAVLTGALIVGDSVRGSLRDLTLDRLGAIDGALVGTRFVRADLAQELSDASPLRNVAPAILIRGSIVQTDSALRASQVEIVGLDERFTGLFDEPLPDFDRADGQIFPSAWINQALADELQASVGDPVLLRFGQTSELPRELLMGEKDPEDVVGSLRLTVRGIVPDRSWGRFGLNASQMTPLNVFVPVAALQRTLDRPGQVNALLAAYDDPQSDPGKAVRSAARFEDLGLRLIDGDGFFAVESDAFVIGEPLEQTIAQVAATVGVTANPVQSYLANTLRVGEASQAYSLVAALVPDPSQAWSTWTLSDGTPAAPLSGDQIYINTWLAQELRAKSGDSLTMEYFVVGPREALRTEHHTFRVAGILNMTGLAADGALAPEYPGIRDAEDISAWAPPFPVDLNRVTDRDEEYWDSWKTVPKAFIAPETARKLWANRYGTTTSVRLSDPTRADAFRAEFLQRESPATYGLAFRPVKALGLKASRGATDFSGLFVGFSFFLILSAAMLVALLFGLGVEQRASEMGLLLAIGYGIGRIRRKLLIEGALLAAAGAVLGLVGAAAYASMLIFGLRTLWIGAVGSTELRAHILPQTLALGWSIAMVVVMIAIALALRRLRRVPPTSLLKGDLRAADRQPGRGRWMPWLAVATLVIGLALVAAAFVSGTESSAGLAFGSAASLLTSGLTFFALWCRGRLRPSRLPVPSPLVGMAARNSSWNPRRSILSVALVASASFLIVAVGANRGELGDETEDRGSGTGGYGLVAESDVALYQDLNQRSGRIDLGFQAEQETLMASTEVVPFRFLPGDDASCLNLYQPEKPRILGVTGGFIERGGFGFKQHAPLPDGVENPWELLLQSPEPGVIAAVADFNSAMWILHLKLGEDLLMADEFGEEVRLRLVGLLDTSVFQSEILIAEAPFLSAFPSRGGYSYFLIDAPKAQRLEVEQALESTLAPFGVDVTGTRQKIEAYKIVEHTYLSTFQMLGGFGLLLGTLGLAIVMVRNMLERRGELATLRAFGYRRRRLGRLVLAENGFLLLVGMCIGTGAALVSVAPRLAGIHVPWVSLGLTLLLIAAVGMVAGLIAARAAMQAPLIPSLKAER